jgi:hypothetical protein
MTLPTLPTLSGPTVLKALERWWPITARLTGLGIGLFEAAAGVLGHPVSAPVLAFAGGLLMAPSVSSAQGKRNADRDGDG